LRPFPHPGGAEAGRNLNLSSGSGLISAVELATEATAGLDDAALVAHGSDSDPGGFHVASPHAFAPARLTW
jgi:hypothetical protein